MKEIVSSITETVKNRLTNSLYGTFFVTWLVFHWNFVFSVFSLDDTKILQMTGLLKNDYLYLKYFNINDLYFWFSWIMPFILTYIIIWHFPKWVLIKAYKKTEQYKTEKIIIKMSQKIKIEREDTQLQEQTAKRVSATIKKFVEEKKIKEENPTISWDEDYNKFKRLDFFHNFSKIIESYYKRKADIVEKDHFDEKVIFEIPEDILAYAHSNEIIEIDKKSNKIEVTTKGKYFINKFLADPNKPMDNPF